MAYLAIDAFAISIHAPRTGSDLRVKLWSGAVMIFQSTLPARGATPPPMHRRERFCISIHAPRTGSDYSPHALR